MLTTTDEEGGRQIGLISMEVSNVVLEWSRPRMHSQPFALVMRLYVCDIRGILKLLSPVARSFISFVVLMVTACTVQEHFRSL